MDNVGTGYLDHTFFIDCDHLSVKDKSKELTANIEDARDKAIRLFYFVKDEIRYNIFTLRSTDACFKASHVLAHKEGYCVQKAVLLVALARAAGIPARLRFAEIRSHLTAPEIVAQRGSNIFPYHGLTDLQINDRWVKATPTYDLEHCKKMCPLFVSMEKRFTILVCLLIQGEMCIFTRRLVPVRLSRSNCPLPA